MPAKAAQDESRLGFWQYAIGGVAIAFVIFQIYTAGFGQFPNMIQRSIHAGFGLLLTYLLLPGFSKNRIGRKPSILDLLMGLAAAGLCLYIVVNYDRLMEDIGLQASSSEVLMGVGLIVFTLESARRATGPILPAIATAGILYALLGGYIPGSWGHAGFDAQYVVEYLYLGPEGIWGVLTGISATLVAAFIIFGAILLTTGGAESFMKMAMVMGGRSYGGAAKVATVASALFGMLSGSAIANVATTGNFTIPMMKKLGYRNTFAGAVEATASSGGQITPPIMGAGAFIMSELINLPYLEIALAATLPALAFYTCVWLSIDLEARKRGLSQLPPDQIPSFASVFSLRSSGPIYVTIVVLLVSLFMGHTPTKAAFWAIIVNISLFLILGAWDWPSLKRRLSALIEGVERAGRGMVTVVSLLVCAQIIIAMISLTGMGIKLSDMLISASGGHLFLALVLAAVVSLILGMGIPTTAAYVLAASVVGPALMMMNVNPLSAHMFIFYCAILSGLTPPVCTAVFAAASIADAPWLKLAGTSIRLAIMKYIIPFFFIYRPSILLLGSWQAIIETVAVTWVSALMFAVGSVGYYRQNIVWPLRIIILGVGAVLILPGVTTDLIGLGAFLGLLVWQKLLKRFTRLPA
ncbi:MAG: TRAP transporter fused permease subunit [Desulfarculaceae bacterium]|jgi:TRAP transporter 4TM/12TM fusion protein